MTRLGPGDPETWPAPAGHPNDPRTEEDRCGDCDSPLDYLDGCPECGWYADGGGGLGRHPHDDWGDF